MTSNTELLTQAQEAIQGDEILEALGLLAELDEGCVDRWIWEAQAWMALSNWPHVEQSVARAVEFGGGTPAVLALQGGVFLARWQRAEAEAA